MQRDAGSTADIVERDRKHFIHPYQVFDTYLVDDVLPIERGAGARLVDSEGRSYIDAVGGMWQTQEVAQFVRDGAEQIDARRGLMAKASCLLRGDQGLEVPTVAASISIDPDLVTDTARVAPGQQARA